MKLTRKQSAFVKHLIDNPKASATEAAVQSYNVKTRRTAEVIAHENMSKPEIIMALGEANDLVEDTLINTVKQWGNHDKPRHREIAIDSAKYIHDKIHGRSKQQVEVSTTSVSINIDLTGKEAT